MLDSGRLVRTNEDDADLADETCVKLPPAQEPNVPSEDMELQD